MSDGDHTCTIQVDELASSRLEHKQPGKRVLTSMLYQPRMELDTKRTEEVMDERQWSKLLDEVTEMGIEAGNNAASWVELDEDTARSILTDVDPEVWDRFNTPNLSGEWADDPTPQSLVRDLGYEVDELEDWQVDEICSVWEDAASETFSTKVHEIAYNLIGDES